MPHFAPAMISRACDPVAKPSVSPGEMKPVVFAGCPPRRGPTRKGPRNRGGFPRLAPFHGPGRMRWRGAPRTGRGLAVAAGLAGQSVRESKMAPQALEKARFGLGNDRAPG